MEYFIGLIGLALFVLIVKSVSVDYKARATVTETLPGNTGSAPDANRKVIHSNYNEELTLHSGSTPPVATVAEFLATLSTGALTLNLTALTGTNGATVDLTGLKVQVVRVKNLGANSLTIKSGASSGHTGMGFTATTGFVVPPGGHVQIFTNDNGDDVDGTHKNWDLTGTGSQTSEWTVIAG